MGIGLAESIMKPAPLATEVHTATLGTSSSAAVDLFAAATFGDDGVEHRDVAKVKITVEADAEAFIVFGPSNMAAAAAGSAVRIAPGAPRFFIVKKGREYYRAIATAADTRLEIVKG